MKNLLHDKIIAFDLDGTLIDSRARHIVLLRNILTRFNIEIDTSDLIAYKRMGKNNIDYLCDNGISICQAKQIQKIWIEEIELRKYLQYDALYPNSIRILNKFKQFDKILVTARNNRIGVIDELRLFKLDSFFKKIFIVNPGKQSIIEKAEILKSNNVYLYIGDTLADYQSASLAKVKFLHVNHGFHDKVIIREN